MAAGVTPPTLPETFRFPPMSRSGSNSPILRRSSSRFYGEAPATDVTVTFKDSACWQFHGHRNGSPMKAKIRALEFRRDEGHGPLRMAIEMTAPEIFASISCDGYQMEPPMSPMVWAVAHVAERTGEVFRLARWKPGSHRRLFTMDWTGQAVDDGLDATDTTTLTLVHIAQ